MKRIVFVLALLVACDNGNALREPDFSWNRMQEQPRLDPYEQSMRAPPKGTIPHDDVSEPELTRDLVVLGRERFGVFCAPCHGVRGDGVSIVASKMTLRKPPSLYEARIVAYDPPKIVSIIEHGNGLMPSYADALEPRERWAVAHWVKALQLTRSR